MSERQNDTPDGPIDEPGAAPTTDETIDSDDETTAEFEPTDEDFADEEAAGAAEATSAANAEDEAAAKAAEADVQRDRGMRPSERRAARATERSQIPIDPALRIKDRASAIFVLITVAAFGLILLNGLVLGKGGLLTPLPTFSIPTLAPTAAPTAVPTEAPSAAPTETPAAS